MVSLHYIGFSDDHRILIGFLLILLFTLGVSWQIKDNANIFIPLCISPAVLLAVERCNNDLIIFLLLFLVVKFALSEKKLYLIAGHLLLYFIIALKYYPVAFSVIFLFRKQKLYRKFIHISAPIIFFCYGFVTAGIIFRYKKTQFQNQLCIFIWILSFNSLISHITGLKIEASFSF